MTLWGAAVVQHIEPDLARVLRLGGVLQLMVKNWTGVITVFYKGYGVERTFRLYDEHELMGVLQELGMMLIEGKSPEELGGFMYFTDTKLVDHCLFFARLRAQEAGLDLHPHLAGTALA